MGIYIRGMDMPKDCRDCPLEMYYMNCGETKCRATGKILADFYKPIPFEGRAEECPLVELLSNDVAPVVHGKWIKKPHWIPLPWDCDPSLSADPDDYDKETHSEKVMWWHCSCCDYSPDRGWKPHLNYCPICGATMDGGT